MQAARGTSLAAGLLLLLLAAGAGASMKAPLTARLTLIDRGDEKLVAEGVALIKAGRYPGCAKAPSKHACFKKLLEKHPVRTAAGLRRRLSAAAELAELELQPAPWKYLPMADNLHMLLAGLKAEQFAAVSFVAFSKRQRAEAERLREKEHGDLQRCYRLFEEQLMRIAEEGHQVGGVEGRKWAIAWVRRENALRELIHKGPPPFPLESPSSL